MYSTWNVNQGFVFQVCSSDEAIERNAPIYAWVLSQHFMISKVFYSAMKVLELLKKFIQ